MIERDINRELIECSEEYPVVTILGPRQSGKTTLVKATFPDKPYFSFENLDIRAAVEADPRGFLKSIPDGAILDEVQRFPAILSYIQGVVDRAEKPGMFILTGSHQPRVHESISQSLAGRRALLTLWPFSVPELRRYKLDWDAFELIVKGFFPRLHERKLKPQRFFNNYFQTVVERDVRSLINIRELSPFRKFLILLAGRVGQVINFTSLANDTGVSTTTIKAWIGVLKASYVIFDIPPFFMNIRKRVVKSPKLYFTDTGLAAFLMGIRTKNQAFRDPLRGGLYENMVIVEIIKCALNKGIRPEIYFFRDSHGNEVDLVIRERGNFIPVEIKSAATFSVDFLKAMEKFRDLGIGNVTAGNVLFNGDDVFEVRGVRAFNFLRVKNIWDVLTGDES